jgi:peptidase inhibitor family I36
MSSHKTFVCMTAIVCLLQAGIASAQHWGHERMPESGACFFKDIEFAGDYFCLRSGEVLRSMSRGMNDRISSIRVFGGAEVTVYIDRDMHGRSARFTNNARDLRREGWNDLISSIVVGRGFGDRDRDRGRDRDRDFAERGPAWGHEEFPRAGACFYRDAGFRGDYFCIPRGGSYTSLSPEFNNSIRSIHVFGADVRIFLDRDFRGRAVDVRRDVSDLRGMWRDTISSIRVY